MKSIITYLLIILLLSLSLAVGCKTQYWAVSTKDNPSCPTTIIGRVHYQAKWCNLPSVITIKGFLSDKTMNGKIIEKTDEGYIFDPERIDNFDLPPKLYKFEDIVCLINDKNELLYGQRKAPENNFPRWSVRLSIIPESDVNAIPIALILPPSEPFSYCLEPNKYKVSGIDFIMDYYTTGGKGHHTYYFSDRVENPNLIFDIKPNTNNYLGDLFIDSLASGEGVIPIDAKVEDRYYHRGSLMLYVQDKDTIYISNKTGDINKHTLMIKNESSKYPNAEESLLMFKK